MLPISVLSPLSGNTDMIITRDIKTTAPIRFVLEIERPCLIEQDNVIHHMSSMTGNGNFYFLKSTFSVDGFLVFAWNWMLGSDICSFL